MALQQPIEDWPEEGVTVHVPEQYNHVRIRKVPLPRPAPEDVPDGPDFRLGRLVINFELVDDEKPEIVLREFDPPIELRVRYYESDMERAMARGRPLTLAFWDGGRWVRFTAEKHDFHLRPNAEPRTGGVGIARIAGWGDPAVGWGD
jgi:hypothetical protein